MLKFWGKQSTPSLPSLPGSLGSEMVVFMYRLKRTILFTYAYLTCLKWNHFWHWNCVLMLNWIVGNRTVLDNEIVFMLNWFFFFFWLELFWRRKCVFMLNWIVWNRIVFDYEIILMLYWIVWSRTICDIGTVFMLNWIFWNRTVLTLKLWTYAKLMVNWIVWNRTDYMHKSRFDIDDLQ